MIKIKKLIKEESLIDKAREFAKQEHAGVKRNVSGLDYFTHPNSVYKMAKKLGLSDDEKILAFLHDTYEDSKNPQETLNKIKEIFGPKITNMVLMISHEKSESYPSYVYKIAKQSKEVLRIKLCDMFCNINDNPTPKQRKKYIETMEYLLDQGVHEPLIQKILNEVE